MQSNKENYMNTWYHRETEFVPFEGSQLILGGFEGNSMEKGPQGGGYDGFGVLWATPDSGGGTAVPVPKDFILDSDTICDWRDILTIPDPSQYDWEAEARAELDVPNREDFVVDYGDGNGLFERLASLMGFEEALVAMAMEPEAVYDLVGAIADYKIASLDYIAKYWQPDTYTNYDDVATQLNTFMSPEQYRDIFLPHGKRIVDRAKELGLLPIRHCCGHAEALVDYFVEEGYAGWTSVQPCNDIVSLLKKYGDHFVFSGGYDTNGLPGSTADEKIIEQEVIRCYETYGKYEGYILMGFILLPMRECESIDEVFLGATERLYRIEERISHEHPEYRHPVA